MSAGKARLHVDQHVAHRNIRPRNLADKAGAQQLYPRTGFKDLSIDTHVFGLRKKLGLCSDVIETIRAVGYRVRSP